jgi:hypothetical protein
LLSADLAAAKEAQQQLDALQVGAAAESGVMCSRMAQQQLAASAALQVSGVSAGVVLLLQSRRNSSWQHY